MRRDLPARFWIQSICGIVGAVLFVLTLFTREWIEELTGFDPDAGSGALEWGIAVALLTAAVVSFLSARRTYRAATV